MNPCGAMAHRWSTLSIANQDNFKICDRIGSPGKVTKTDEAAVDGDSAVQAGLELWHDGLLTDSIEIVKAWELQSEAQAPVGGLQLAGEERIEAGGLPQEPDEDCSGLRPHVRINVVQALKRYMQ